jgi:hypothetical protein
VNPTSLGIQEDNCDLSSMVRIFYKFEPMKNMPYFSCSKFFFAFLKALSRRS